MQDVVLSMRQMTKIYGNIEALSDVSIQIKRGDIYGLVGNNGASKTTLMRLIAGQSVVEKGNITLFGAKTEKGSLVLNQCGSWLIRNV